MKIFFVHQKLVSFVEKDLNILKNAHEVKSIEIKNNFFWIFNYFKCLWQGIIWCDVTFSWFGKLHAFFTVLFSKILGKKSIVVAGGDDVVKKPEIKYGMGSYWWKKWCPLFVFKHADLILPVSKFNEKETIVNGNANPEKIRMIYHGFDYYKFSINKRQKGRNIVLSVGGIDWERVKRKGYEVFVKSAKFLPDVQFVLVGKHIDNSIDYLKKIASPNVNFTGKINDEELIDMLKQSKIYVQVSLHEAFGCSLAEAMLCECIPVVSSNAAIPEVVGDTGVYVDKLMPEDIANKIQYALSLPDDYGKKARDRIIDRFPLNKRKQQLLEVIESISNA